MEGGKPACAAEEGVGRDSFTVLKADEAFFEGEDISAKDLDVLSDQVKEIGVVK